MRRAFLIMTAGVGSVLGWGLATVLAMIAATPVALAAGTAASALFVGTVFEGLRTEQ
jgi:hypothetical protein